MRLPDRYSLRERMRRGLASDGAEGIFSARFATGLTIIAIGALLLFDSLSLIDARHVLRQAWPLVLIVIGISLLQRRDGRRRNEGWALIIVGAWIFSSKIGLLDLSFWRVLFPLLLMLVGGLLVYRSLTPPETRALAVQVTGAADQGPPGDATDAGTEPSAKEHAEFVRSFTMLSRAELCPMSRPFKGADLSAVWGGIELDLSAARMEGDSARVEVFAFFGSIEIQVPPDWAVTSKVATLIGGFSDKPHPAAAVPSKVLIVDGFAIVGGIEVKS